MDLRYADDLSNHYYQDESFDFQFPDYESENDLDAYLDNETDGGDDNAGDDNAGAENSDDEEPEEDDNDGNNSSFPVFTNDLVII